MGQVIYCLKSRNWTAQWGHKTRPNSSADFENWNGSGYILPRNHGMNRSGNRTGLKCRQILKNWNESSYILLWNHGMNRSGHRTGPKFVRFWKLWIGSGYILLEITELMYQAIEPGLTSSHFENWNESGYILPGNHGIDRSGHRTGHKFVIFWKLEWVRLYTAWKSRNESIRP